MSQDAAKSGDGLGAFSSSKASDEMDDNQFRSLVESVATANGTATLVSKSAFTSVMARVYSLFGATSKDDRNSVDLALTYFFAVHGTSPETEWATYEQAIIAKGRSVHPKKVIDVIGLHRLKKTMGHFSALAIRMVSSSQEVRAALSERAARANLASGQEYMAIDFVGKDGSLSHAESSLRVATREALLNHRARNANNIAEQRGAERLAHASATDARALGGSASSGLLRFDN